MSWRSLESLGVVAAMGLSALGCETLPTQGLPLEIVGEWEWMESVGGIAGVTNTPASTGQTLTLIIRQDGSLDALRDGVLWKTVTYLLVPHRQAGEWDISYSEPVVGFESQHVELRGDVLILTDGCCDGFTSRFRRER